MKQNSRFVLPIILVVMFFVTALIYFFIIKPTLENRTVTDPTQTTIENKEIGLTFSYLSGESAYTLIEPPISTTTSDGLKKAYIIMGNEAYIEYQSASSTSKTPPAITLFVLSELETGLPVDEEEDRLTRVLAWAERNPQYTSFFNKTAEPENVEIDSVKTLHYNVAGEYNQEVYLASYKNNIYVFVGQYENKSDDIANMFKQIISSILFS